MSNILDELKEDYYGILETKDIQFAITNHHENIENIIILLRRYDYFSNDVTLNYEFIIIENE